MGQVYYKDRDGLTRGFNIEGTEPTASEQSRISAILSGQPVQTDAPKEEPGVLSSLGGGIGAGWNRTQGGVMGLAGLAAQNSKSGTLFGYTPQEFEEMRQEQNKEASEYAMPSGGLGDNTSSYLAYQLGQSLPTTAASVGAALIPGIGPVLGTALMGATSIPQSYNENLEEQIGKYGKIKDPDKALQAAIAQGALEGLADRMTLGASGLIGGAIPGQVKNLIKDATQRGIAKAAKQVGTTALTGAGSEGVTEALQQALTRWQAEKPLGDEEAQKEYLENAIVGGILGGAMGGVFGATGAVVDARETKKYDMIRADLDAQDNFGDVQKNIEGNRIARMKEAEGALAAEEKLAGPSQALLEDLRTETVGLRGPKVVGPLTEPTTDVVPPSPGKRGSPEAFGDLPASNDNFTTEEYVKAVDAMRNEKLVSADKIKNSMKIGRKKADAIFETMLGRLDAKPAGSKGQYLTVVSKVTDGKVEDTPTISRRYETRPVEETDIKPYRVVKQGGRQVGPDFKTAEEAHTFAGQQENLGDFAVIEETSPKSYGVYEVTSGVQGQKPVSRFVRAYSTDEEARDYANSLNPQFSPETNQAVVDNGRIQKLAAKKAELGGKYQKEVQQVVDKMLGPGRAAVDLAETLRAPTGEGIETGHIIEGAATPLQNGMARISVAAGINDPNLSPDQFQNAINSVAHHEVLHVAKEAGLFTPAEWKSLVKRANTRVAGKPYTYLERAQVRTQGAPAGATLDEEAVAEMVRDYMRDPTKFENAPRSLLRKLLDFVRTLGAYTRHVANGNEVLRDFSSGKIGQRKTVTRQDMYGPYYSSVKIPPFYLKSAAFFEKYAEQDPDRALPGQKWIGYLRNDGKINPEELAWLGLKDWLNGQKSVTPKEILQYIGANSVDIKEKIYSQQDFENRLRQINRRIGEIQSQLEGKRTTEEATRLLDELDRLKEEKPTLFRDERPKHEGTTQEGGEEYKEMLFHMPHLEPQFAEPFHFDGFPNVLAFGRFKTRTIDGKKVLFIEEMQSDLHQKGRHQGYTSKSDVAIEQQMIAKIDEIIAQQKQLENSIRNLDNLTPDEEAQAEALGEAMVKAQEELAAFQKKMTIPDAPLKTVWSDFVIKRLVRHAAENGFDSIAWNGEPMGVAMTEHYIGGDQKFEEYTKPDGTPGHRVVVREDDGYMLDEKDVSGIVNFYTKRLARDADKLFNTPEFGYATPQLRPRDPVQADLDIDGLFPTEQDFDMAMQELVEFNSADREIGKRYKKAQQVVRNQRQYDPMAALTKADVPIGRMVEELQEIFPQLAEEMGPALNSGTHDASGNPNLDRWIMDLTPELKEVALDKGFSMFSSAQQAPTYNAYSIFGTRAPSLPPPATLTDVEARMTYNNIAPKLEKLFGLVGVPREKAEAWAEGTIIGLQDKYQPLAKLLDRVRANNGMISNETDTYLRNQLRDGVVDIMTENNDKNLYQPLSKAVFGLNVTQADVDELLRSFPSSNDPVRNVIQNYTDPKLAMAEVYIYAQHAKERNRLMRQRNDALQGIRPEQYEHGSGLSDLDADTVLNFIASKPYAGQFMDLTNPNSIRSRYRKLIANTNDLRVQGGLNPDFRTLINPATGRPFDEYQDYAPLRGFLDNNPDHQDDLTQSFMRMGKGLKITGKEDKSALGRQSQASHLIANAVLQNQEAIIRSEKNKVGQTFLNMLKQNMGVTLPSPTGIPNTLSDFAEIVPLTQSKPSFDKKTGTVRMVNQNIQRDPDIMVVKQNGKETGIRIKDARLRDAMIGNSALGGTGQNALIKGLLKLNRMLAAVRTSLNPEFLFSNFFRDLEGAMLNLTELEARGLQKTIAKDALPAVRGVYNSLRENNPNNPWRREFEEFAARGGKTAFMGVNDLDSTLARINEELITNPDGKLGKAKEKAKAVFEYIENVNDAVENGIRVSTYKHLKQHLLSLSNDPTNPANIERAKNRAAFIAKNLTVNFNMGGTMKPTMNAWYLFFNASLQGSAALANPLIRSKKVRRIWLSAIAAGALQDIIMSSLSGEADDGQLEYDKIPEQVLETNMVFMNPFSDRGYVKIPMPYLFNAAWNSGRALMRGMRGGYSMGETINSVMGTAVESLNPWGGGGSWLNYVAPTVLDPAIELVANQNFMGAPIQPPESPYGTGDIPSQRYWNNTSPAYITVADMLDAASGGDGVFPGVVSFSPNQYEYAFEFLGGGALSTIVRAWDFLAPEAIGGAGRGVALASGDKDISVNDVPFFRRLLGNITTREDLSGYLDKKERVLTVRQALRDAMKDGEPERYQRIMQEYPEEYKLAARINSVEATRKKIGAQIKKIREAKTLTDDQKKKLVEPLKKQQEALVDQANALMGNI